MTKKELHKRIYPRDGIVLSNKTLDAEKERFANHMINTVFKSTDEQSIEVYMNKDFFVVYIAK